MKQGGNNVSIKKQIKIYISLNRGIIRRILTFMTIICETLPSVVPPKSVKNFLNRAIKACYNSRFPILIIELFFLVYVRDTPN